MYQSMDKVNANLGATCDKTNPETVSSKLGDIEDANNNLSNNQEVMDMRRQLDYLQVAKWIGAILQLPPILINYVWIFLFRRAN